MKHIHRILVGIALDVENATVTPGSRRAALQAQWLAEKCGAALTFVHSTWSDLNEDEGRPAPGLGADGRRALDALVEEYASSGTVVQLVVSDERPWLDLIQRARRGEGQLVMVARRNHAVSHALGSVALKLLRKCPAPVWVVKPDAELVHHAVLAATDLTPVGDRAVEYGAFVAKACGCELHVVHAWQVPLAAQFSSDLAGHEHDLEDLAARKRRAVEASVARVAGDSRVRLHVGRDTASHAILEGVERLQADLLVMGTVSRGGIAGLLVGNTAEKLLDRSECAILAIKPEDFVCPMDLPTDGAGAG